MGPLRVRDVGDFALLLTVGEHPEPRQDPNGGKAKLGDPDRGPTQKFRATRVRELSVGLGPLLLHSSRELRATH